MMQVQHTTNTPSPVSRANEIQHKKFIHKISKDQPVWPVDAASRTHCADNLRCSR